MAFRARCPEGHAEGAGAQRARSIANPGGDRPEHREGRAQKKMK